MFDLLIESFGLTKDQIVAEYLTRTWNTYQIGMGIGIGLLILALFTSFFIIKYTEEKFFNMIMFWMIAAIFITVAFGVALENLCIYKACLANPYVAVECWLRGLYF